MGWPFPMLKRKYIFQIKYTEAILSNSTRKPLWCSQELKEMLPEGVLSIAIRADIGNPRKNERKAELIKYWHQRANKVSSYSSNQGGS